MKIIDILNAKESLVLLSKCKFSDFKITNKLYKLTKKVNEVLDMVQQEQRKIVSLYVSKDDNGNPIVKDNQYQFDNVDARNKFIHEIEELKNSQADEIERLDIQSDKLQSGDMLTVSDVILLEPLINWI